MPVSFKSDETFDSSQTVPIGASPDIAFSIRRIEWAAMDSRLLRDWSELEQRALEKNAYLSPRFVVPAVRHLDAAAPPFLLLVLANAGSDERLVGLGVFRHAGPTCRFPLRHLVSYRCVHSFLSGILIDEHFAVPAARALFQYLCDPKHGWHGVDFVHRTRGSALDELMSAIAQEYGIRWCEYGHSRRALLMPAQAGADYLEKILRRHRYKELRRMHRRLAERGDVVWRLLRGGAIGAETINRFVELEHLGWKGERGDSLRANPAHERFFCEMMSGFSLSGQAFFAELVSEGKVIASTSNLISGNVGFAFKIGWDPRFSNLAPGLLNEAEMIRRAPSQLADLDYVDSGADEDSFIGEMWVRRRDLTSGVLTTTSLGHKVGVAASALRKPFLRGTS